MAESLLFGRINSSGFTDTLSLNYFVLKIDFLNAYSFNLDSSIFIVFFRRWNEAQIRPKEAYEECSS